MDTPLLDTLARRVTWLREKLGISQSELARRIPYSPAIKPQSIQQLEEGNVASPRYLPELADFFGVSVKWLRSGEGVKDLETIRLQPVGVIGAVAAGEWREALEWPPHEQYEIPLPIDERYRGLPRFGLEVKGRSMDEVYPEGSILACVKLIDLGRDPEDGERVICQSRGRNSLVEATVKKFVDDGTGNRWLVPQSSDPAFQSPVRLDDSGEEDAVQIIALVIGSYRPE